MCAVSPGPGSRPPVPVSGSFLVRALRTPPVSGVRAAPRSAAAAPAIRRNVSFSIHSKSPRLPPRSERSPVAGPRGGTPPPGFGPGPGPRASFTVFAYKPWKKRNGRSSKGRSVKWRREGAERRPRSPPVSMAAEMSDCVSLTLLMASSISLLDASAFRLALRFKPAANGFSLKTGI